MCVCGWLAMKPLFAYVTLNMFFKGNMCYNQTYVVSSILKFVVMLVNLLALGAFSLGICGDIDRLIC